MQGEISSAQDLIKKSLYIFFKKKNLAYFVKLMLVILVLTFGTGILSFFISGGFGAFLPDFVKNPAWAVLFLILFIVFVVIGIWTQAAIYESVKMVVKGEPLNMRKTLKVGWRKSGKFFLVGFLSMLIVFVGLVLLIVPGIIFAVWFSFSRFVVIKEGLGVRASLKRSRELVRGRFWPILGRYLVFFVVYLLFQIALGLVPYIGTFAGIVLAPLFILPSYLLYQELSRAGE